MRPGTKTKRGGRRRGDPGNRTVSWPTPTPPSPKFRPTWPRATATSATCRATWGTWKRRYGRTHGRLEIRQRLADANPTVTTFQADLAVSHNNIGNLQVKTGHPDDAMWSFTRSLAIRQRLANANPTVSAFRDRLATTHYNIGLLQSQTGHLKDGAAVAHARRGDPAGACQR